MCGIAGFTRFNACVGDERLLRQMGEAIAHRGPDAHGEYLDEWVGLAHRRLSIIDVSENGNQPMLSADGSLVLVFNGEIYNYRELRAVAQQRGYDFRTQTDTEVILAIYRLYGQSSMLQMLNGMFAFALWDKRQRTLFVARDRLGKKPFYYYAHHGYFIFASEIKSILTVPFVPKTVCYEAVYDFFSYQYIPEPKTIFDHMYKLEPGHWMTVSVDGLRTGQYWDVSFAEPCQRSEADLTEELYALLETCTLDRLVSDVPLGAFLSGGVDSSSVVGLMAKHQSQPVKTCSIGFEAEQYDELKFSDQVAQLYKTEHQEYRVSASIEEHLQTMASFFDEPFADPSLVPTYLVSQLAKQKVTVALAGDGGDENFAGYHKYSMDNIENRIRSYCPLLLRRGLFPSLATLLSFGNNTICRKGRTLLETLSHSSDYAFFLTNTVCHDALWNRLVLGSFRTALQGYHPSGVTVNRYRQADGPDHLSKILYTDIKTYLAGDILVKVDRMSMAHSLEVRAPILDYRVVEFAAQLPSQLKLYKGEKKYLFKQALTKLLPNDIVYRDKMGFSVPLAEWLRRELMPLVEETLICPSMTGLSNFFDMAEFKTIWHSHQSRVADYSDMVWSALMFELWWQRYT